MEAYPCSGTALLAHVGVATLLLGLSGGCATSSTLNHGLHVGQVYVRGGLTLPLRLLRLAWYGIWLGPYGGYTLTLFQGTNVSLL